MDKMKKCKTEFENLLSIITKFSKHNDYEIIYRIVHNDFWRKDEFSNTINKI